MPLPPGLAQWLRESGHEADHVSDLGLFQASDEGLLLLAQEHQSVIITYDLDFPRLLALLNRRSPGVILFRGGPANTQWLCSRLATVFKSFSEERLTHAITVIDRTRIRSRPLPL